MFGRLVRMAVDTVTLPVTVVADVITLGGDLTDRREPYTVSKAKRIIDDGEKAMESLIGDDK